tara:strand:+ start:3843 stop:4040 length:198 start_codon:yes stop_codon:yes gene_type:complete
MSEEVKAKECKRCGAIELSIEDTVRKNIGSIFFDEVQYPADEICKDCSSYLIKQLTERAWKKRYD